MKIAVTYDNGMVFQHYGHTEQFKIYDIEENKIVSTEIVSTNGSGHGALAGLLSALQVKILICGGIGAGAKNALKEARIELFGGVTGLADLAVQCYLNGTLLFNPDVMCNHHGHEHNKGHSCGSHGCGDKHN